MINICPNCHAVSFGKKGWRYVNHYNRVKLCINCNTRVQCYPAAWAPAWWLQMQQSLHTRWESEHHCKASADREPVPVTNRN